MDSPASSAPRLPHARPFVYVDRIERDPDGFSPNGDRAVLGITVGPGSTTLPATLLLEAMAQATLALMSVAGTDASPGEQSGEAAEEQPTRGLLVGIDEATFDESLIRTPPRPGDRLVSRCEVRGQFGRMAKVAAWMERDGVRVASAEMLLAGG